ncbi:DUF3854 domain-containing protein [Myxosarcina sp. GI1]|uniref:DUF3854 domain-containing protein n=1 Tax=Myxosarcina sp. GI1 TaxID=1541065 RepID=UPI00056B7D20|nr:DUF3854 domain-containing protein [Myxosarcina sp. GI1]
MVEALEKTQDFIQQFDRNLQLQKLEVLEHALERKHTVKLEGLEQLANTILNYQATEAIAETMTLFDKATDRLQEQVQQKLTRIADSFSQNKNASQSRNARLSQLASSVLSSSSNRPFWQPDYKDEKPKHIEQHHWEEFKQSAIHPDLASLNAVSLKDYTPHEYLLYDLPNSDRLNSGRIRSGLLNRYSHLEDGGWWGNAGTDALSLQNLQDGEKPTESLWGCFKPDNPRVDETKSAEKGKTKHIKYETPPKTERVLFLPEISEELAEKIYQKHNINPTVAERESGFWYVIKQYPEIPITIAEGFKKTLASLSQGEVTIGLSGVNHIYKSYQDGKKLPQRELNPQLSVFTHSNREFRFAYDRDTKTKTIINVRRDMVRGIELLEAKGCKVKVLKWNADEGKGLDDLIAKAGPLAYTEAHKNAISSDLDKKIHYRTEYNKLAEKVRQSFGNIGSKRLDLEVYIHGVLKGEKADGARILSESDRVRFLRKNQYQLTDSYIAAIVKVAGTYKNLSEQNTSDLDALAQKMVERHTIKHLEEQREQEQEQIHRQNFEFKRKR